MEDFLFRIVFALVNPLIVLFFFFFFKFSFAII